MNPLEQVKKALDEAIAQKKLSQEMLHNLGPAVVETLQPILNEIAINSKISKQELLDALSQLNITIPQIDVPHATVEVKIPDIVVPEPKVTVNVPEIKLPDIVVPEIKVPKAEVNVKIPPIKIPSLKWPEEEMPIKGWVQLMGVDTNNPLPVQLRDAKGNPISLFENLTQIVNGGGGGKKDFFTVKGFSTSAYSELTNADGRLRVSTEEVQLVKGSTATTTVVSVGSDSSTSIVPTQINRKSISLVHESSFILYVSSGTAVSTTSFPVVANQAVVFDDYVGPLQAIAQEGAGTISVRYIEII